VNTPTEVERAAPGNALCFVEQCLRIEIAQGVKAAQMPFTIGVQTQPGLGHRQVMADRGHGVLQGWRYVGELESSRSTFVLF
jgi:hypothetical protein